MLRLVAKLHDRPLPYPDDTSGGTHGYKCTSHRNWPNADKPTTLFHSESVPSTRPTTEHEMSHRLLSARYPALPLETINIVSVYFNRCNFNSRKIMSVLTDLIFAMSPCLSAQCFPTLLRFFVSSPIGFVLLFYIRKP